MPIKVSVEQTGLERSIQNAAKKAGRNLKVDLGSSAKDIKSLEQPLGKITGKADEFTKSLEASNARVIAFGASVGIINGVVQSFKSLVSTTIEVEKSLTKINSILNTNVAGLNNLKNQIFDIAKNTEQTFDVVAEAALELSRQGLNATEVTKRLNDSLILSRLAGINASEAVSGLTAAVNSFSKAGLTTGEVLNKISAAANKFAVSERDLIEGFKRSASVAEQAGVSIDELGGIITAVQQRTARGGAVIGNSFKTIFTRIGRAENLELLSSLGVQITDVQGKILPATKLIENLAGKLEELDQVQVRSVTEKIGGGFQIAPLLAALSDYSSETSIAIRATEAFANATNEAYKKNEIQNQTLSAAINKTTLSVSELANSLGELGVLNVFKSILSGLNSFTEGISKILQGDSIGERFAQGIIGGLGKTLITSGIALFGVIIGKLAVDLAKFGISSLKTFFGLNKEAERLKSVQQQIVGTLLNDKGVRENILRIENSSVSVEQKRLQQAEFFNTALRERVKLTSQLNTIASGVAPNIIKNKSSVKRSSGGYLPIGAEQKDINSGVGGAPSGAKPVVIPNFAFGSGKRGTMVANSSEYIVPNFAGGGSAIFNQDMVKSMGLPSGAKKINAAGGFIPNFAAKQVLNNNSKYVMLTGEKNKSNPNKIAYRQPDGKFNQTKTKNAQPIKVPVYGLTSKTKSKDIDEFSERLETYAYRTALAQARSLSGGQMPDPVKRSAIKSSINKGSVGSFAGSIYELSLAALLTDEEFLKYSAATDTASFDLGLKGQSKLKELYNIGGDPFFGEVKGRGNADNVASTAAKIYRVEGLKGTAQQSKLVGKTIPKDDAVRLGLLKGSDPNKPYKIQESDLGKIGVENFNKFKKPRGSSGRLTFQGASGYIPNYANGGALEEAIQRERDAGVPINQIRINQDGKLRNSQNPNGIAVTNTRDEPTGAIPNFASKGGTTDELGKAADASVGKLLALSFAASTLGGVFGDVNQESSSVVKAFSGFTSGLLSAITTLSLIQTVAPGVKIPGQDKLFSAFGKGSKGAATGLQKFGGILLKGLPIVGTLFAGFQIVSQTLKAFGIDVLGFLKDPAKEAADNLEKLSDAALKNAITTGEFSTKPFEDFLGRVGTLSDEKLKGNLSKRGREALSAGNTNVINESVKDSLRTFGAEGVIGDLILGGVTAKKSRTVSQSGLIPKLQSETITAADLPENARKLLLRNLAEGKRAGSGITGVAPSVSGVNFNFDPKKIQALFDAQFAAIEAYADPKQFAEIVAAERSGDKNRVRELSGELLKGQDLDRYTKLIEDIANITNIGSTEGQKQLKLRIKQEQDFKKEQIETQKSKELVKKIELEIADIRRKSITESAVQLTNLKSQVELAQKLVLAKKSSTAEEKLSAQFQLDAINSQRKLTQEVAKAGVSRIEGSRKELGLTQEPGGEIKIEKERTFNELVQLANKQLIERGRIDSQSLVAVAKRGELSESQINNLETIIQISNEEAAALTKKEKLQLSINTLTKAQAALTRIAAQEDERRIKNLEKQLDFNEKNLSIEQQIANARSELAKSQIDAGAINGNQFSKFSATQQKAAVDQASIIRNFTLNLNKSVGDAARKALNEATAAGVTPTQDLVDRVKTIQKDGADFAGGGDVNFRNFINDLEKQSKEAVKRERDAAIDKSIAEINNILTMKGIIDEFGVYVSNLTGKEGLAGENFKQGLFSSEIPFGQGFVGRGTGLLGQNTQDLLARKSQLEVLKGKPVEGSVLNPSLIFQELTKLAELAGVKLSTDLLNLANSVAEAGGSLTTFNNLVRNELNGIRERVAQNQFTLATSADPSQIQSSLIALDRESVLKETGSIGEANKVQLIKEKEFEIETAIDSATKERLNFELQKTLDLLDIREQILKTTQGSKERESLIKTFQEKTKEQQSLASQLKGRISKTSEQIESEFNESFLNATDNFANALTDGLTQAISKGEDLGDVLLSAAAGFIDELLRASFEKNLSGIFSSLSSTFVDSGSSGSDKSFLSKVFGYNSGGMVASGSGMKDDVPAVLNSGEYVVKKDAVMKYGPNFMDTINNGSYQPSGAGGGIPVQKYFIGGLVSAGDWSNLPKGNYIKKQLSDAEKDYYKANYKDQSGEGGFQGPGLRGAGAITGKENLLRYSQQSFTSGATDVIQSSRSASGGVSAIDLEAESVRLSTLGRSTLASPLQQANEKAKLEAFGLRLDQLKNEEEYESLKKIYKKALKDRIKNIWIGAASQIATLGLNKLMQSGADSVSADQAALPEGEQLTFSQKVGSFFRGATQGNTYGDTSGQSYGGLTNLFTNRFGVNSTNIGDFISSRDPLSGSKQSSFNYNQPIRGASERPSLSQANTYSGITNASSLGLGQQSYDDLLKRFNQSNPRFAASGGYIPDAAGIDTVPAMLNGGEFVMNSAATQRLGSSNLERLNSGSFEGVEGDSNTNEKIIDKLDELIEETKKSIGDVSVTVNGSSEEEGSSNNGETEEETRVRNKEFASRLKREVLKIIEDQKRVGGTLRGI